MESHLILSNSFSDDWWDIRRRLRKITVKRTILRKREKKKKTPITNNEYEFFKLFHSTKTTRKREKERERHLFSILHNKNYDA